MESPIMADDTPDSCRKNPPPSSADESQDRSKRHKHRHHHRSHHRRHRHRSRTKDGDVERRGSIEVANVDENVEDVEQPNKTARPYKTKVDSDMEEGEIVEDEEFSGGGAEFDASNTAIALNQSYKVEENVQRVGDHEGILKINNDHPLVINNGTSLREMKSPGNSGKNNTNGEVGREFDEGEVTLHRRSCSPAKRKNKTKGLSGAETSRADRSNRLSVDSHRSRSKSPSYVKRKSHSQSTVDVEYLRQVQGHACDGFGKGEYVFVKDINMERRHAKEERDQVHELWNSERKEKGKDRKMDKETKLRDRDHEEERRRHGRDRDHKSSRDRETIKEREDNRKGEKQHDKHRDVINDGKYDEVRCREKDRSSKARDPSQRGSSPSSYIDRDMERERSKDRERYRDGYRDLHERRRDNESDRHIGKVRDVKNDKVNRRYRHDDEHRYGGHGRSYESKYDTNGNEDYHRNSRNTTRDSEKVCMSRDDSLREIEDKVHRDGDYQDDYPENMDLELEEQEEEDINRIKEESRKRRNAILQKYRTKELQNKVKIQSDAAGKALDKEICGEPSGEMVALNGVQDRSDDMVVDEPFCVGKSISQNEASTVEESSGVGALGEGTPKSERSNDMFCDDIFGGSPDGVCKMGKGDDLLVESSLHDNWDDPEGYYGYRLGEILDGRYEIAAAHGKGVFSTVVRAKDLKAGNGDPEEVAIKIIRSNDTMLKAGMDELVILKKLVGADPDDRRHCVRYISSFKYRNHLCLVFESLHMNLREVLKKFGRNIGLKLTAVRAYSKQLFIALKHLKNCGVLHCDIKPDNMLVSEAKNVLKLCDFGNAMFAGKNEVTPYLVSRFYRAPEIILGLAYDHPLDMWSVACCMYELYTGKVLFPGATNNDMLRLHMELKGPFPKKMLRKGAFTAQNFDQDLNFLAIEEDVVTKKTVRRLIVNIRPKDIGTIIKGSPGEEQKMLANFKDLLDKIFVLDPDKRLTVSQALSHPFISGNSNFAFHSGKIPSCLGPSSSAFMLSRHLVEDFEAANSLTDRV
ncbi:hypothetical protein V2J09_005582 [Rumex salicifolius]